MGVLHRYIGKDGNFEWEGVPAEKYEKGGAVGGTKCVLIGGRDSAVNFGLRLLRSGARRDKAPLTGTTTTTASTSSGERPAC